MNYIYILTILIFLHISEAILPINLSKNNYYADECVCKSGTEEDITKSVKKSAIDIENMRIKHMIPGLVAGISVKGKNLWTEAFGKTDIENDVKTHRDSVWRMASISKSLTTALVAKLIEKGLIDLEKSIYTYLKPEIFPVKQWKGKNVTITVKQVMSHMAGLRVSDFPKDVENIHDFKNVTQTISQFKNADLIYEPGTNFNYSNYGFQIIGAIIESVLNETYESAINNMFKELGMSSTFAERHEMIIPHRAHYYMRSDSPLNENWKPGMKVEVLNAHILDDLVSLERWWPAGGLVSTVDDLLIFGNYMLNSSKGVNDTKKGYIKQSIVKNLWTAASPQIFEEISRNITHYAKGWIVSNFTQPIACSGSCKLPPIKQMIWHSGGITGVTTLLCIFPEQDITIVLLSNLGGVNMFDMVFSIATNFLY